MLRPFYLAALCTLLAVCPLRAGEGDPVSRPGVLRLSLESAIRMALAKNFTIQVQEFAPRIAQERIMAARGAFDPELSLGVQRTERSDRTTFGREEGEDTPRRIRLDRVGRTDRLTAGINGITPLGTEYDFGFDSTNSTGTTNDFEGNYESSLGFGLRQPLLRGFGPDAQLSQLRIARTNAETSEWQLRNVLIDVITDVAYAYNDLHTAHETRRVAESTRELARHLMENNQQRVTIGVMTPLDVTTARAEVASREEGVILARRNVLDNENLLKQLVTRDLERMLAIRVEIEPPPSPRIRTDVLGGIRDALEIRPDYRQQLLEIQRRNIAVKRAKNDALPQLDLVASLDLLGFDRDFLGSVGRTFQRDATSWTGGATFSYPIGNRTARADLSATRLGAAQALVSLQELEQKIVVEVDNAAGQVVTNRERIASTSEARKLAAESLAAGEERLRAGTGTTFEVLELQDKLASAELAELRARSDYNKAIAEFRRKTGTTLRIHGVVLN